MSSMLGILVAMKFEMLAYADFGNVGPNSGVRSVIRVLIGSFPHPATLLKGGLIKGLL